MALYSAVVSLEIPVVIEADDETHAREIARDDIRIILENENLDRLVKVHAVREVSKTEELPNLWDGRCIPYGGDGNTRIVEILARDAVEKAVELNKSKTPEKTDSSSN